MNDFATGFQDELEKIAKARWAKELPEVYKAYSSGKFTRLPWARLPSETASIDQLIKHKATPYLRRTGIGGRHFKEVPSLYIPHRWPMMSKHERWLWKRELDRLEGLR